MVSDCTAKKGFHFSSNPNYSDRFSYFLFPAENRKMYSKYTNFASCWTMQHSIFGGKNWYRGAKGEHYHHILHIKNAIGVFSFLQNFLFPAKCSNSCHCNRLTCKNWCSIQNNQVSSKNTRWC